MDSTRTNIKINLFQWNSQSLRPKLIPFSELLNQENVHIAMLSETWLDSETDIHIRGYNIYRSDRYDSYDGGFSILVHKSIRSHQCSVRVRNSGIEIICVKLINCKDIENVIAIYCPSSVQTQFSDWEQIFSLFSKNTVIAGDFNGHHTNWSVKTDIRGTQILDAALENSFVSLNNCEATRVKLVSGNLQETSPDISFTSSDIAIKFDWQVFNENLGSDHMIIKMSTSITNDCSIKKKKKLF